MFYSSRIEIFNENKLKQFFFKDQFIQLNVTDLIITIVSMIVTNNVSSNISSIFDIIKRGTSLQNDILILSILITMSIIEKFCIMFYQNQFIKYINEIDSFL